MYGLGYKVVYESPELRVAEFNGSFKPAASKLHKMEAIIRFRSIHMCDYQAVSVMASTWQNAMQSGLLGFPLYYRNIAYDDWQL